MTGADLMKARRAAALIEAGIVDFLSEIERSLVDSMAARVLTDMLSSEQATAAWTRLGEIRAMKGEVERRARQLQPTLPLINGGRDG
jgi:hypothetical protein